MIATLVRAPQTWDTLLAEVFKGSPVVEHGPGHVIYRQGEPASGVCFLLSGKVQLAVSSQDGKEAIVATFGPGEFFGEGCLAGQPVRTGTATSVGACSLASVDKVLMAPLLHGTAGFADLFIAQLLARILRCEADLVDQIFNSSEKRLARMLLLLSHFGKDSTAETVVNGVNQEHLAQMVGTTRSRINFFMNKFRKLGYIDYETESDLTVHRGLLRVLRRA
jgi:CRP/FNR family cyclic AMP-dependent transcriptional regulator